MFKIAVLVRLVILLPVIFVEFIITFCAIRRKHFLFIFRNLIYFNIQSLRNIRIESLINSKFFFDKFFLLIHNKTIRATIDSGYKAHKVYLRQGHLTAKPLFEKNQAFLSSNQKTKFGDDTLILGPDWIGPFGHISSLSLFPKMEILNWVKYKNKLILGQNSANIYMVQLYENWFTHIKSDDLTQSFFDLYFRNVYQSLDAIDIGNNRILDTYTAQNLIENSIQSQFNNQFQLLKLDKQTTDFGANFLEKIGMDPNKWFVTLHVRENRSEKHPYKSGDNADINTYKKALDLILELGGQIIRIGDENMTPLTDIGVTHKNRVFDYAISPKKHKLLDVYFLSSCKFMIATGSGPMTFPNEFGVPILLTNLTSLGRTYRLRGISTPQLIRDKKENNLLNIEDLLKNPMSWNVSPTNKRFERVQNSETEIYEATLEIYHHISNIDKNCWMPMDRFNSTKLEDTEISNWQLGVPLSNTFKNRHLDVFRGLI